MNLSYFPSVRVNRMENNSFLADAHISRRRTRRVRCRHQGGAARPQNGVRRDAGEAGWDLPERRVHPQQGPPNQLSPLPRCPAQLRLARDQRRERDDRRGTDAAVQIGDRRGPHGWDRVLVQEEQGRLLCREGEYPLAQRGGRRRERPNSGVVDRAQHQEHPHRNRERCIAPSSRARGQLGREDCRLHRRSRHFFGTHARTHRRLPFAVFRLPDTFKHCRSPTFDGSFLSP